MKIQRLAIALALINLVLLICLVTQIHPTLAQSVPSVAPVLRGRALEIVDDQGRVRASITVEPPVTVDSRKYPETVLFRMRDPQGPPRMKFSASEEGVGLDLVGDSQVRVLVQSKATSFVKLVDANGREQVIKP